MSKLYTSDLGLFVRADNPDLAAGLAEIHAHVATEFLRKAGSGWVQDRTTKIIVRGTPMECTTVPDVSYDKDILIKAFGEETAIRLLNYYVDAVHP